MADGAFRVDRVKGLREALDLSQADLAERIGVSRETVSGYEQGRFAPGLRALVSLCVVLACSADYLLGLADEPGGIWEEYTSVGLRPRGQMAERMAHGNSD